VLLCKGRAGIRKSVLSEAGYHSSDGGSDFLIFDILETVEAAHVHVSSPDMLRDLDSRTVET
jgi:hypothetical protein